MARGIYFAFKIKYHKNVMEMIITKLKLAAPLYYEKADGLNPFEYKDGEKLFCFELNEKERVSFEPSKDRLLERLVFGGIPAISRTSNGAFNLPAGDYFFSQKREILPRNEIFTLAAEIQAEVIWQRLSPGSRLYLRYLFEDGKPVTQLFRPYGSRA